MINIYKKSFKDIKIKKIKSFEKGSWVSVTNPDINEIELIANKLNLSLTIVEDALDENEIYFNEIEQFNEKMLEWIIWYNTKRFHWSLNLQSPVDYLIKNNMISNMRWTNTSS
ncbi:IS3 family transposase [Patescibacteria group bacterium]|nr:IS3 family transposase [Patescibacteria group bacterium]